MLRFTWSAALLAAALALANPTPVRGSIVQALTLQDLVAHSDRIVLGQVLFSESFQHSDGQIGTWHRIRVERDIRTGDDDEREVIVETLGGRIGDLEMHVEGEPSFSAGERVIVFLRGPGPFSAFRPVGMGQGVMRIRSERGLEIVTQSREGMLLMRRNARGRWQKSVGVAPETGLLDTFVSAVRAIIARETGGSDE